MAACGAAVVYIQPAGGFPKLLLEESVKKWQRSFFYVKNANPAVGRINLPPFVNASPTAKQNWATTQRSRRGRSSTYAASWRRC